MKWNKLFDGDGLPREKVDAVVRVVDRYLPEEAELHRLQTKRQTVHSRNLTRKSALGRLDMLDAIVHTLHVILAGRGSLRELLDHAAGTPKQLIMPNKKSIYLIYC